jgi:hypothetical protein
MIHPHTEVRFISETVGYGVVATKFIPKGTITWALDKLDRTFDPDHVTLMDPVYQDILEKYCYRNNVGELILCWDIARFVNHSFNSNCISTPYEFEIAVRDIHPGEELTDDYGYLNVTAPFDCLPEKGSARKSVMPDDLLNFHPEWDAKLQAAFPLLNEVDQPLMHLLPRNIQDTAKAISNGKVKLDSILLCYFDNKSNLQPSFVGK